MKALILAGGFGTRMYPLTENIPKALLKVDNKPIIEYIIDRLKQINNINEVYILSNNKFYMQFLDWKKNYNAYEKSNFLQINLINNGINNDFNGTGAIADLKYALDVIGLDDFFIIASDNLFFSDLNSLLNYFIEKNSSVIGVKKIDDIELIKKYSNIILDDKNMIIDFEEKPQNPKSNLSGTACYLLTKKDIKKILKNNFIGKQNLGCIVEYLHKESKIYGIVFEEEWFDIGSIEGLEYANSKLMFK